MSIHIRKHGNCYHLCTGKRYAENNDWVIFYFRKHFELTYSVCGYFDNRPEINIALFFFMLTIKLPVRNKWTDECDAPTWGIAYHNQTFWIYRGGKGNMNGGNKWWTFNMPWQYIWIRTSNLKVGGTWEHEIGKKNKEFYDKERWKGILWTETYQYTYILKSGEVQNRTATIRVEEREWRQRWLKWTKLFSKVIKTISIDFNDEVGEETGSWKGGCTGCGYTMNHGELPEQTLRRMEKERKF